MDENDLISLSLLVYLLLCLVVVVAIAIAIAIVTTIVCTYTEGVIGYYCRALALALSFLSFVRMSQDFIIC